MSVSRLEIRDYVTVESIYRDGQPEQRGRISRRWATGYELEQPIHGRIHWQEHELKYFDMIKFVPILIDHCCELEARIKVLENPSK